MAEVGATILLGLSNKLREALKSPSPRRGGSDGVWWRAPYQKAIIA